MCTRVTSSFLPVGRHRPCGHDPTLRYFFVFSHLSTCIFLSSLIALHFLKNPSEVFKNSFNQSEGEDCNGVWNWLGLYWNKFWLCLGQAWLDKRWDIMCFIWQCSSDNTFIVIYRLRACNKVIGDKHNRRVGAKFERIFWSISLIHTWRCASVF